MPQNPPTHSEPRPFTTSRDTFVVRIWREDDEADPPLWRGWVQHVQSGDERYVDDVAELIRFVEDHTGKLDQPRASHLK